MVAFLLLTIQILIFALFFSVLKEYSFYLYGGSTVIGVVLIFFLINRNIDGGIKQSWLILMAVLPIFGVCLYLYVRADIPSSKLKQRINDTCRQSKFLVEYDTDKLHELNKIHDSDAGLFNYLYRTGDAPVYQSTYSEYFPLGEDAFKAMTEELKKAENFIFMEYFIININGHMWNLIYEILKEKVKQGVDVRVMYDGMGSLATTNEEFFEQINNSGIKCRIFAPVKPFLSTYQNNRDHRKMLIIDGKTAFSGGINISDEYINRRELYGHWKDNSIMLKGEAVKSFTLMFLRMWNTQGTDADEYEKYIHIPTTPSVYKDDGYVCPFADGPSGNERIAKSVYMSVIDRAQQYVHIITPYLILDDELKEALKFAAKRNVDVKILMPHIPDKWYAFALARTYYPELILAGVKIYEYTPGFVHAKTVVSDDLRAVVGTSNFDYRSLFLHYECAVYFYQCSVIDDINADFIQTLEKSQEFTVKDYKSTPVFMRIVGRILRAFAPLM